MAIIYEGIACALCEQVIDNALLETDDFVATTHFIEDETRPLWNFSDAVMHRGCFMAWPLRQDFIQAHNEAMKDSKDRRGLHLHMNDDGELVRHNDEGDFVFVDEEEEDRFVEDYLRSIGKLPLS